MGDSDRHQKKENTHLLARQAILYGVLLAAVGACAKAAVVYY